MSMYFPTAHSMQSPIDMLPTMVEYKPAAQSMQSEAASLPGV